MFCLCSFGKHVRPTSYLCTNDMIRLNDLRKARQVELEFMILSEPCQNYKSRLPQITSVCQITEELLAISPQRKCSIQKVSALQSAFLSRQMEWSSKQHNKILNLMHIMGFQQK